MREWNEGRWLDKPAIRSSSSNTRPIQLRLAKGKSMRPTHPKGKPDWVGLLLAKTLKG